MKAGWIIALLLLGVPAKSHAQTRAGSGDSCRKSQLFKERSVVAWKTSPGPPAFFYESGMAIDADGAYRAYHPRAELGLDSLPHAGYSGNWWALVTDNGKTSGHPVVQGPSDPAPGYYVSTTSLSDRRNPNPRDPRRYVDALTIPFIVLPPQGFEHAHLGDFAMVMNRQNGQVAGAIVADESAPGIKFGEASIALADMLGIDSDPRYGGNDNEKGVAYVVYPGSGNGQPRTLEEIASNSQQLFESWGGIQRLNTCLALPGGEGAGASGSNQPLPLAPPSNDRAAEAHTEGGFASASTDSGQKEKALDSYLQALPKERATGNRGAEADTLANIASAYEDLGEEKKAIEYYTQALRFERALADRDAEADSLAGIGRAYEDLGEKRKALEYYSQALPLQRAVGDDGAEADTLDSMGHLYDDLGEKQKALEYLNHALTKERALADHAAEGQTLDAIGSVYDDLGKVDKATVYYSQALPVEHAAGDRAGEAATLDQLGDIYDNSGDKQKALSYFAQELPLVRTLGDRDGEAIALDKIGSDATELGERQEALDSYVQALALVRAFHLPPTEVSVLGHLMNYWRRANRPSLAIFWGKEAVNSSRHAWPEVFQLDEETRHSFVESDGLNDRYLADLFIEQGRLSEAEQVLQVGKEEKEYFEHAGHAAPRLAASGTDLTFRPKESEMHGELQRVFAQLAASGQEMQPPGKPAETNEPAGDPSATEAAKHLAAANSVLKDFFDHLNAAFPH